MRHSARRGGAPEAEAALFTSLRGYDAGWLRGDLVAGLTVWAVLVPEALAYASIAGVSPVVGLYAAPGALLLYAAFGSSRHLVVGPMSVLFVNAKRLRDGIRVAVRDADPPVRVVLLDLSFTPELDIESVTVLASLRHELDRRGVALWLAGVRAGVEDMLARSGLADAIGRDHLYREVEDAAGDASA